MTNRERTGGGDRAAEVSLHRNEPRPDLEDGTRVDHVLGRRAPVHVRTRLAATRGERTHERNEGVLGLCDPSSQLGGVVVIGVRLGGDAFGRVGRNRADLRLGERERALGVEPALDQRAVVERAACLLRAEQVSEQLRVEDRAHRLNETTNAYVVRRHTIVQTTADDRRVSRNGAVRT